MASVIAIRHVLFEDLGGFETVLRRRGHDIAYIDAATDDFDAVVHDTPLLIVLGGPIGANDEALYPFLKQELGVIEQRLKSGLPLLGICLGAQLIARALGARIYPARAKELGWAPIALTAEGERGALRHLGRGPVLHWHGDTFDLPAGATRLAATDICANQAFARGANLLALQFHPEAEARSLERWYVGHTMELALADISVPTLRAATAANAPAAMARGIAAFTEWLDGLEPRLNP